MQATLITLSVAFLLSGPQPGSVEGGSPELCLVRGGLVKLIHENQVPAREAGVLERLGTPLVDAEGNPVLDAEGNQKYLEVREGLQVKRGQVLGLIDDEMERRQKKAAEAKLEVGNLQAENKVRIEYAEAAAQVAAQELEQGHEANRQHRGTVPAMELTRLNLAKKQAVLSIKQSDYDWRIDVASVKVREAEDEIAGLLIDRRRILAPFDGIVVKRYVNEQEWVQPGEPVLRVIRMDRLRIEGFVDATQIPPSRVKTEQKVTLRFDSQRSIPVDVGAVRQPIEGRVVFVSPEIVSGMKYEVWAEVDNVRISSDPSRPQEGHWLLYPGSQVDMTIHLDDVPRSQEVVPIVGSK